MWQCQSTSVFCTCGGAAAGRDMADKERLTCSLEGVIVSSGPCTQTVMSLCQQREQQCFINEVWRHRDSGRGRNESVNRANRVDRAD